MMLEAAEAAVAVVGMAEVAVAEAEEAVAAVAVAAVAVAVGPLTPTVRRSRRMTHPPTGEMAEAVGDVALKEGAGDAEGAEVAVKPCNATNAMGTATMQPIAPVPMTSSSPARSTSTRILREAALRRMRSRSVSIPKLPIIYSQRSQLCTTLSG
jgi:hypothetical protein